MVTRTNYLNALDSFIRVHTIKILAGIRRCGKSTILKMLKEKLVAQGVEEACIIERNFATEFLADYSEKALFDELLVEVSKHKESFVLLDEVQEIPGWEKAINALFEKTNADIYVTGSNSKLTSAEISSYLSGRFVLIPVYTLTFDEFLSFKNLDLDSADSAIMDYIKMGGFPLVATMNCSQDTAYQIVRDIYNTVVTNDISQRHLIKKVDLFDRIVRFIVSNNAQPFSATSIIKYLKSENRSISNETLYNYIKWLEDAFIIYRCNRYDVNGKAVLKTQEKYYLGDISLRYALFGYNPSMLSSSIENIVFLEMKKRGYTVYTGKDKDKEIDFIGERLGNKVYVQVCTKVPQTSDRETANLIAIRDNYPKYLVSLDSAMSGSIEGISCCSLAKFLLSQW